MVADIVSVEYITVVFHIVGDNMFYMGPEVSTYDSRSCKEIAKCFLGKIIATGINNRFKNKGGKFVF